jgi:hypothetical protein
VSEEERCGPPGGHGVEVVELLPRRPPVEDVRFVPQLPQPCADLVLAVGLEAVLGVRGPSAAQPAANRAVSRRLTEPVRSAEESRWSRVLI